MKVIFIDVDGVLCLIDSMPMPDHLDKNCLANLKRAVDATGAELVLSSSWRAEPPYRQLAVDELSTLGMELLGDTPVLFYSRSSRNRHVEIAKFLETHPEITKFVVVDDSDNAELHGQPETFVKTDYDTGGLNDLAAQKIIDILK